MSTRKYGGRYRSMSDSRASRASRGSRSGRSGRGSKRKGVKLPNIF